MPTKRMTRADYVRLIEKKYLASVMKENPQLRTAHAFLGTSLMAVLVVHAGLGLKLALEL